MFVFHDLDATTRNHMLDEANLPDSIYISPRLTAIGKEDWPVLLREAIRSGTPESLAAKLGTNARLKTFEISQRDGRPYEKKVPSNAAQLLAEGEFNRYYWRALCLRAIAEHRSLTVYRGRHSDNPKPESEAWLGKKVEDPHAILKDLRKNIGGTPDKGLPSMNSGLTVRLS
jgi:hypothetical protein